MQNDMRVFFLVSDAHVQHVAPGTTFDGQESVLVYAVDACEALRLAEMYDNGELGIENVTIGGKTYSAVLGGAITTVLIMQNERYQPDGVWVFVYDLDLIRDIVKKYGVFGTTDEEIKEFMDSLREMPLHEKVKAKLGDRNECYLHDLPQEWRDYQNQRNNLFSRVRS